jgi:serine/threonine protein kinase
MEKQRVSRLKNTLIFDVLSKGQFGLNRLGINFDLFQLVVIKEISLELINNQILYDKLKEEGKIVWSIPKQSNIVQFFEISQSKDNKNTTRIEQEYMDSGNLLQFLKKYRQNRNEPLDERIIQHFINSFCKGLSHLHKHKIMHRDIKLENIMLSFDRFDLKKELSKSPELALNSLDSILKTSESKLSFYNKIN